MRGISRRWMALFAMLWLQPTSQELAPNAWAQGDPGGNAGSPKTTRSPSQSKAVPPASAAGLRLSRQLGSLADGTNEASSAAPLLSDGLPGPVQDSSGDRRIPLPSGDLNRGGIVPASRMRLRDGELILEPPDADIRGRRAE